MSTGAIVLIVCVAFAALLVIIGVARAAFAARMVARHSKRLESTAIVTNLGAIARSIDRIRTDMDAIASLAARGRTFVARVRGLIVLPRRLATLRRALTR